MPLSPHTIEWLMGAAYVLLGPGAWAAMAFSMVKGRQRMDLLGAPPPLPVPAPAATILIPVKDEAGRIRESVSSALAQDYPDLQAVVIDDRSADGTGQILDEVAGRDPRLRVLHLTRLPKGWTGKCHALHRGMEHARGRWLLFVDSDVVLQPGALRSAVALAEHKGYDLVSLLPRIEAHGFWERLLVPLCGAATGAMYLIALTNYNEVATAFANGQFLCIRRDAYDRIGGHEAVRDRFCEDVEIARKLKRSGGRPRLSWGNHLAAVRMYSSLREILRGWSRNFFAGSLGRPWRVLAAMAFLLVCGLSVVPAAVWGVWRQLHPVNAIAGWGWLGSAALHAGVMLGCVAAAYAWSGNRRRLALLFPLGGAMLLGIFARAAWMCVTGKVEWRGTRYTHRMSREVPLRG